MGMLTAYSFFFRGVKVAVILASSLGKRVALMGLKMISDLYLSGTLHSYSIGILASFLTQNFYLVLTPM
jgi:hypothetical protein